MPKPYIPDDKPAWFMQDVAPPYCALAVGHWLHQTFAGRWVCSKWPEQWAPRSQDLIRLTTLFGCLKSQVLVSKLLM
jgi:hypothetical protein